MSIISKSVKVIRYALLMYLIQIIAFVLTYSILSKILYFDSKYVFLQSFIQMVVNFSFIVLIHNLLFSEKHRIELIKISIKKMIVFVLLGFIYASGTFFFTWVLSNNKEIHFNNYISIHEKIDILIQSISLGLMGSFSEELLYRGYLFSFLKRQGLEYSAIFFSAILFGLTHIFNVGDNDLVSVFLDVTMAGVLFGYITYKTNVFWYSIPLHYIWNSFYIGNIFYTDCSLPMKQYLFISHVFCNNYINIMIPIEVSMIANTITIIFTIIILRYVVFPIFSLFPTDSVEKKI